jgi:hypothetical protein
MWAGVTVAREALAIDVCLRLAIRLPCALTHLALLLQLCLTGGDSGAGSGGRAIGYERLTQTVLRCVSVRHEVVVFSPPSIVLIDELSPGPGTCEDKVGACAVAAAGNATSMSQSTI